MSKLEKRIHVRARTNPNKNLQSQISILSTQTRRRVTLIENEKYDDNGPWKYIKGLTVIRSIM